MSAPKGVPPPHLEGKRTGRKKKPYRSDVDADVQVGILIGAGWTTNDVAQLFGVTHVAIVQRRKRNAALINKVIEWTRMATDKYVAERIKEAEDEIAERKKNIKKKSYRIIEKTLDHGLAQDETSKPEKEHLAAAEMALDRTEGKAIDRKQIHQLNETLNSGQTRDLSEGLLNNILTELQGITHIHRALPAASQPDLNVQPVEEAETVGSE